MLIPSGAPGFILFSILFVGFGIIFAIINYVKLDYLSPGSSECLNFLSWSIHKVRKFYFLIIPAAFIILLLKSILHNLENVSRCGIIIADLLFIALFSIDIFFLFPRAIQLLNNYLKESTRLSQAQVPPTELFK